MKKNNSGIVAVVAAVLVCFLSVLYTSCKKSDTGTAHHCADVCQNGGYCNDSGKCACPAGYEDAACATPKANKFLGTWNVFERTFHSDTTLPNFDSSYIVKIDTTATPTTFFINQFRGNPSYNKIIALIDSTDSSKFTLLSWSPISNPSYEIISGFGVVSDTAISGRYVTNSLDTFTIRLTPHH